jgi:hypothetical protein
MRKRGEIEKWCSTTDSEENLKERKKMKEREYDQTSEALFLWFA